MIIDLKLQIDYSILITFAVNLVYITKTKSTTKSLTAGGKYYLVVGGCHDMQHDKNPNFFPS